MNTIPPQGVAAVRLIFDGMAPILVFMIKARLDEMPEC